MNKLTPAQVLIDLNPEEVTFEEELLLNNLNLLFREKRVYITTSGSNKVLHIGRTSFWFRDDGQTYDGWDMSLDTPVPPGWGEPEPKHNA